MSREFSCYLGGMNIQNILFIFSFCGFPIVNIMAKLETSTTYLVEGLTRRHGTVQLLHL